MKKCHLCIKNEFAAYLPIKSWLVVTTLLPIVVFLIERSASEKMNRRGEVDCEFPKRNWQQNLPYDIVLLKAGLLLRMDNRA